MEVYNSKFLHLSFFPEEEIIEMTWLPATERMTEDDYKQTSLEYLDVFLKFCPQIAIADTRTLLFPIIPELQAWTNHTIIPKCMQAGLKRIAIVINQDMILQLSVEQIMQEDEASKFQTHYFASKEAARAWCLS